ncbi:hypothetical protein [Mycolicibacterium fortuitum]|uniref:hypothetical protein n=1 Tax=Mycolicibacterium fortuitum TaxID=1766 RepID=UPI00104275A7|nr:hypothetical protein [Mycolicibacterium fortuitum]
MHQRSESDLAWDLVEHTRASFSVADLNKVFVLLGIWEFDAVIRAAIGTVANRGLAVPASLLDELDSWASQRHPDGPTGESLMRDLARCRRFVPRQGLH